MEMENNPSQKGKHIAEQVANAVLLVLKSNVVGIYLTGSAVLGDWRYGKSDIDLTVVVRNAVPKEAIPLLKKHMKRLEANNPKVKMEIQYIPVSLLGKNKEMAESFLAYHSKKHDLSHFNFHPVTWISLKKHGATLWGKPIEELNITTTEEEVSSYIYGNVNTYWTAWAASAKTVFSIKGVLSFTDWAVEWCVCGLSRMYFTLREKDITSKSGAVEYMLEIAPREYQKILQEARRIRQGKGKRRKKLYLSRAGRRKDVIEYMRYVIGFFQN